MTLAELSIRRPVLTIVIALFIMLMGGISLTKLPVREYPAIDPPTVSITTSYPGAAAEVVQTQITERIEEAVNTVAGIDTLSSVSREGASIITAEFKLGVDLDEAANEIGAVQPEKTEVGLLHDPLPVVDDGRGRPHRDDRRGTGACTFRTQPWGR